MPIACSRAQIAVVIATKDREAELANRALRSVASQKLLPDFLVVVDDSHPRHREANRRIVAGISIPAGSPTRIQYLRNDRTPGASGAWNVALDWLHRHAEPENVMVAILDDDDRWEHGYLAACARAAEEQGLDMVAADIVRHESSQQSNHVQAPDALRARDFLVTNPGIQGSNLFVRLATLLAAGLFDEALLSATDRDLCIRLADLGFVRYGRIAQPLVHHFADRDRRRLSTPGSPEKLDGLNAFWRKYHRRMTEAGRAAFAKRSLDLFGWKLPTTSAPSASPPAAAQPDEPTQPVSLVVGMTTPSTTSAGLNALLDDLVGLRDDQRLASLEIVILENGPRGSDDGRGIAAVAQSLRERGITTVLVPIEQQTRDAMSGVFGRPFNRAADNASIAVTRTMLQMYLYWWARKNRAAAVWILDDDMRLENLVWRGGSEVERGRVDIVGALGRLRDDGVDIAIGTVTDAPPVPFASCVRTQLVDAWHNLELLAALDPDETFPELLAENMATRSRFSDYYYDLSRRETDHLETPFWYVPNVPGQSAREVFADLVAKLPRILAGEQVFRPLVHDASIDPLAHLQPSVHRGGNTFVFDHEALRDFPNGAPRFGEANTRRSDMVWSLLNRYGARRRVVKVPLPVRQQRAHVELQKLDLDKLVGDIHGYAVYSALDDVLLERCERSRLAGDGHKPDELDLEEREVAFAISRFRKYLSERLYAFQLSFHRAGGLARSLARYVVDPDGGWWWARDPRYADARDKLAAFVRLLNDEYDLRRLKPFRERVRAIDDQVVREWLGALRAEIHARRSNVEPDPNITAWVEQERVRNATVRIERTFGTRELSFVGSGAEAVVLTDGMTAFKCIDARPMPGSRMEFLRDQIGCWKNARTLCSLEEVRRDGPCALLAYRYVEGAPYRGGCGGELRLLLDECRDARIVCTNIHPQNLIVSSDGAVKLADYGADIEPFTEDGGTLMARRAWLSGRHANNPALKDLMRRSLSDANLPELEGLDAFLRADPRGTKETLLDASVERAVLDLKPASVFDFGCGKGRVASTLGRAGLAVTAYDPDPRLQAGWSTRDGDARFLSAAGFAELLAGRRRFEVVLCNLVLCVIADDAEFLGAVTDLARLVAPGGRVIAAVCNPLSVERSTLLQRREAPTSTDAKCITWKTLRATGVRRRDVHRPLPVLLRAFNEVSLDVVGTEETPSIDPDTLDASSDFLILHLTPRRTTRS